MGKPSSNSIDGYLELSRRVLAKKSELRNNRGKIASPYILLMSFTVVPAVIYYIARNFFSVEWGSTVTVENVERRMELSMYGSDYSMVRREAEAEYQVVNDRIETAMFIFKTMLALGVFQGPLASRISAAIASKNSILEFGKIMDAMMEHYHYRFIKKNKDFSLTLSEGLPVTHDEALMNKLAQLFVSCYVMLHDQLAKLLSLIPRGVRLNTESIGADLPEIDFATRTLHLDRRPEPPTFSHLALLVTSMKTTLDQMDKMVRSVTKPAAHIITLSVLAQLDALADKLVFQYAVLFTFMTTLFIHRFITTRVVLRVFPSEVDKFGLTSQELMQLEGELNQALTDSRAVAQRNLYLANAVYGVAIAAVSMLCMNYGGSFALSIALPYLFGILLDKLISYGLDKHAQRQLDSRFNASLAQLQRVFPDVEITPYKNECIENSFFMVTIRATPPLSQREYMHCVESTLERFGIRIHASFYKELLLSCERKIPTQAMQAYFGQLIAKRDVDQVAEITAVFDTFRFTPNLPAVTKPVSAVEEEESRAVVKKSKRVESSVNQVSASRPQTAERRHVWRDVCGETVSSDDSRVRRIEGHHGSAYLFFRLLAQGGGDNQEMLRLFFEKASLIARARMGAQGIKWHIHPDGSVGRVKVLGKFGDVGLLIYRQPRSDPSQPILYYTDEQLSFGVHS